MGLEVVKGKNGKYKLWNTVVSDFEAEFETCTDLVDYLDKRFQDSAKHSRQTPEPLTPVQRDSWLRSCFEAPTEKKFKSGLVSISMEDILKYAEKD